MEPETTEGSVEEPNLDGLLERILWTIRSFAPATRMPGVTLAEKSRRASRRLMGEMAVYFGAYASVLAPESEDGAPDAHRTLARAGTLLTTFLGRQAAMRITDEVLGEVRPLAS